MADPLQQPAFETPPDVVSLFPTTHSDEQAWFFVVATLSSVVPGTLLLLRLYTKVHIVRRVDLTDCTIPHSQICGAGSNEDIGLTAASFVSNVESGVIHTSLLT